MSTIREVAERAGVSTMTVSRAINRTGYISQEARQRVQTAITELGYVPNTLARSLRSKTTRMLALVLTDIANPFFTTLARGVEDEASEHGFSVIFANTDESEAEQAEHLLVLVKHRVDGILLVPALSSPEGVEFLRSQGVPLVVLDRRVPGAAADCVRGDSEQGAYELVKLLTGLGHTRIAALSGPEQVSTAQDRVVGYRRAMAEAGLGAGRQTVLYGPYSQAGGYFMAQRMLQAPEQATALFAGNNLIAVGAYQALADAGLRVPEDCAIVTFDDVPSAAVVDPFFTVAVQPAYEMGRKATQLLLARRLKGGDAAPPQEIVLPVQILIRRSSGGPRGSTAHMETAAQGVAAGRGAAA